MRKVAKHIMLGLYCLGLNACDNTVTTEVPRPVQTAAAHEGPYSGLKPSQLGLIVNDNDPMSVEIAQYYRVRRGIPLANIVHVNLPVVSRIGRKQFLAAKTTVDAALPVTVQALAIAWTRPYRVECNSITSAFAMGFAAEQCEDLAGQAVFNPYFNSASTAPFTDYGIRPAMMLAGENVAEVYALIDRGILSDGTQPTGSAYLMNTRDSTRSLRARVFPRGRLGYAISPNVLLKILNTDSVKNTTSTLFYFQGLAKVSDLPSNEFPPGAYADHLTSHGGKLTDSTQMSVLRFTEAGVTGTYGTVSEPYAIGSKFPDPGVIIDKYTKGNSLIESLWKSVEVPAQGAFVGEPLANPWSH